MNALARLQDFARPRPAVERCSLCAAELAASHAHLVERGTGQLRCACATCERLLAGSGTAFTPVPRRVQRLDELRLTDADWQALGVPVELAFFVHSTAAGRVVARYPSAAGTVASSPAVPAWEALVAANPVLGGLAPDVEALLVHRGRGRRDHYLVAIDECYRLVGLVRRHWRGFSGGPEVFEAIERFFDALAAERSPA